MLQKLNALESEHRDELCVSEAVARGGDCTVAVQENEVTCRAEVTHVDRAGALRALRAWCELVGVTKNRTNRWKRLDQFQRGADACFFEFRAAVNVNRQSRVFWCTSDERTSYNNTLLNRCVFFSCFLNTFWSICALSHSWDSHGEAERQPKCRAGTRRV